MRRFSLLAVLTVVLVGLVALDHTPGSAAQNGTPTAGLAGHPLVGTWIVNDPSGTPSVTTFTSDGIVIDTETGGGTGLGSWQATGARTASFTFVIQTSDPTQHFTGTVIIRGTAEVDTSGNSLTSSFSYTVVQENGTVLASGKGQVTGTRLPVESPDKAGTPLVGYPTVVPSPVASPSA